MTASAPVFDRRTLAPGITLHLHPQNLRKTNDLSFFWVGDLGSDVAARGVLASILTRGTRSHPGLRELSRRLETLYGAAVSGDVQKIGERLVVAIRAHFANDGYLPAGESILAEVVDLVREVLTEPHLENGVFPASVVEQEIESHRRLIESLINDKRSYAIERCVRSMCADEEYRRYVYGDVEDLEGLTPESLTQLWQQIMTSAPAHLYFSGDVDADAAASVLETLATGRGDTVAPIRDLPPLRGVQEVRHGGETLDVGQTQLVLGYRTATRFGDPLHEPLVFANGILGLFSHSKLFLNVREKASLCYYASSWLDRSQGLMFISSGIDDEKRDQALALIQEQVRDLQEGKVSEEEMESTRRAFDNRLVMLEDNPRALMDIDIHWRLNGVEYDHEQYRERLARVTPEEVVEASRRLELDTVFLLQPNQES